MDGLGTCQTVHQVPVEEFRKHTGTLVRDLPQGGQDGLGTCQEESPGHAGDSVGRHLPPSAAAAAQDNEGGADGQPLHLVRKQEYIFVLHRATPRATPTTCKGQVPTAPPAVRGNVDHSGSLQLPQDMLLGCRGTEGCRGAKGIGNPPRLLRCMGKPSKGDLLPPVDERRDTGVPDNAELVLLISGEVHPL